MVSKELYERSYMKELQKRASTLAKAAFSVVVSDFSAAWRFQKSPACRKHEVTVRHSACFNCLNVFIMDSAINKLQ